MNSLKEDKELKDLLNKTFEQAFEQAENINYLDQTSKIIIQSALRQAINLNNNFYQTKEIVYKHLENVEKNTNKLDNIVAKLN
tara:strand:- start:182 stop:430 length:249 start_codon:yes stop_codon:yes gene_type:complete